ncbi:MAG: hypothetical protein DCC49_06465 [Acidobacteria bacterium]|nr:MAG: hypothetical protein DCC49_06465 [Acidobacteriota bacterium]
MKQVETRIFLGMARRAAILTPPAAALGWLWRGPKAGITVLIAVSLVLAIFGVTAYAASIAAQISPGALGGAFLIGFVVKLGAMTAIVAYLRKQPFIDFPVFFGVFAVSYLVLLTAETSAWVKERGEAEGEGQGGREPDESESGHETHKINKTPAPAGTTAG